MRSKHYAAANPYAKMYRDVGMMYLEQLLHGNALEPESGMKATWKRLKNTGVPRSKQINLCQHPPLAQLDFWLLSTLEW